SLLRPSALQFAFQVCDEGFRFPATDVVEGRHAYVGEVVPLPVVPPLLDHLDDDGGRSVHHELVAFQRRTECIDTGSVVVVATGARDAIAPGSVKILLCGGLGRQHECTDAYRSRTDQRRKRSCYWFHLSPS